MGDKHKNPQDISFMIDMVHVCIGILIVIMAVVAFLNPEKYMILFPLIFFLAGVLNAVNGVLKILDGSRDRKKRYAGIGMIVLAAVLLIICMISAVSIWR